MPLLGDILPRLQSWASHARTAMRWFGNLRLRPDAPMGVPRPRYSYPVKDSEVPDCFTSVWSSEGLLFAEANTKSTASFRTVNHDGEPSQRQPRTRSVGTHTLRFQWLRTVRRFIPRLKSWVFSPNLYNQPHLDAVLRSTRQMRRNNP